MCVILTSAKGQLINREYLETSMKSNGHGAGFSYCKDGKLFLEKGFFKFEEFYEAYKKVEGYNHIFHARFRTHGETDKDNCHPFIINENLHMAHNGVLHGYNTNPNMSDTFNFCEDRLKPLTKDTEGKKWWKNSGFKWLIESVIGSGNKFAMLDSSGDITVFNEHLGEWVDDEKTIWASNNSYKVLKTRNDPRVNTNNYFSRYESDHTFYAPKKQHQSTLFLEDKTKKSPLQREDFGKSETSKIVNNEVNLFDISEEELKEVDDYLDTLNSVSCPS